MFQTDCGRSHGPDDNEDDMEDITTRRPQLFELLNKAEQVIN